MNHDTRIRKLKLIDAIRPFFASLATCAGGDTFALDVCRHLQAKKEAAIEDDWIAAFIDIWHSRHPEEGVLANEELLWALESIESDIASRLKADEMRIMIKDKAAAKLRVVHGGLSGKPDIPYENLNPDLQIHTYADF